MLAKKLLRCTRKPVVTHAHTHVHTRRHMRTRSHALTGTQVRTHKCKHMHARTHTRTHTHTHTCTELYGAGAACPNFGGCHGGLIAKAGPCGRRSSVSVQHLRVWRIFTITITSSWALRVVWLGPESGGLV
jgi:hypothetical protein